ncbi:MAG: hypothetical protein VYA69_14005 [Gemmatimonadota bacterium]|nr:hypothetical protein [Gemmatimonadota bacterium]
MASQVAAVSRMPGSELLKPHLSTGGTSPLTLFMETTSLFPHGVLTSVTDHNYSRSEIMLKDFSICSTELWLNLLICLILATATPAVYAQNEDREPAFWRQLIPGSTTVKSMFATRSPQFIMYREGLIVYRNDLYNTSYQQVRLTKEEQAGLVRSMEGAFRLSGITTNRLRREDPYIQSVQKTLDPNNKNTVVIWLGMHSPPSLHRYRQTLLEARSGNDKLGPAWNMLYELNQYLSSFNHPRAKPLVPEEIEIAVQALPSYLSDKADSAKHWPFSDVSLENIKGARNRGFKTLTGNRARSAYSFLSGQPIISDGDSVYEVWVRPILLPKR